MEQLTVSILTIFAIMIISYLTKLAKLVPENTVPVLTSLLFNVTLPALILSSMASGPGREILRGGFTLVGINFVYCGLASLLILFYLKNLPSTNRTAGVLAFSSVFANTAFVGLPIIYLLYGDTGVILGALFDQTQTFFMFTLGILFVGGREGTILQTIAGRFKEPVVISLLAGIILLLFGVEFPAFVMGPLKLIGGTTSVLAMFTIGQFINLQYFKDLKRVVKILPVVALKLLVIPLAVLWITGLLPLDPQTRGVLAIMLASPTAILAAIFAKRFGSDYELAVMAVVATTGLSIITLPFILSMM
ncbi:MAG: AEC family transporter [Bacillota bacterium]